MNPAKNSAPGIDAGVPAITIPPGTAMSRRELQVRESLTPAGPSELQRVGVEQIELHAQWPLLSRLPMRVTVAIVLPKFRVRDLLALQAGTSFASTWPSTDDVPFWIGEVQMGWSEFEVIEQKMAVRLTRLA